LPIWIVRILLYEQRASMSRYSFFDLLAPRAKEVLLNMVARWGYNRQELAENTAYREAAFAIVFVGVDLATYPIALTKLASQNDHELINDLSFEKTLIEEFHIEKKKFKFLTIEIIMMVLEFMVLKILKEQKIEIALSKGKGAQAEFDHIDQIMKTIQSQVAEGLARNEAVMQALAKRIEEYDKRISARQDNIDKLISANKAIDTKIKQRITEVNSIIKDYAKESIPRLREYEEKDGTHPFSDLSDPESLNEEFVRTEIESAVAEQIEDNKLVHLYKMLLEIKSEIRLDMASKQGDSLPNSAFELDKAVENKLRLHNKGAEILRQIEESKKRKEAISGQKKSKHANSFENHGVNPSEELISRMTDDVQKNAKIKVAIAKLADNNSDNELKQSNLNEINRHENEIDDLKVKKAATKSGIENTGVEAIRSKRKGFL